MRTWLTALLLASTGVAPALAQPGPPPDRGGPPAAQPGERPDREPPYRGGGGDRRGQEPRGDRGPGGRPGQGDDVRQAGGDPRRFGPDYHHNPAYGGPGGPRPGGWGQGRPGGDPGRPGPDRPRPGGDGPRPGGPGWSGERPDRPGGNSGRPDRPGWNGDRPGRPGWDGGRPGWQGGGPRAGGGWDRGWRDDRRYDWQGWRERHQGWYRRPAYRAPYGYGFGYRSFVIGAAIPPAFFAQDYWIGDPGYYRLPPAYGPYRWVRYYGDALLVDVYTGRVVDVIRGIFW